MGAFNWLSSIGRALGAFPDYAAQSNMDYALYRALGPDWKNIYDQEKRERELGLEREEIQNKQMRSRLAEQEAKTKLAVSDFMELSGRWGPKYTPAKLGAPETATLTEDVEIAAEEMGRRRKSKESFRRAMELEKLEPEPPSDAEKALAEQRRASAYATKHRLTPEYLEAEAEAEEGAKAKYRPEPEGKPAAGMPKPDIQVFRSKVLAKARELAPDVEPEGDEPQLSDYPAEVIAQAEDEVMRDFRARSMMARTGRSLERRSKGASVRKRVMDKLDKGVPKSQWEEDELAYIEELRRKRALARR